MPGFDLPRRVVAEGLGTALLVATVVGSGIMAETLTKDLALTLLCNTIATGAMLVVLITILGPVSGAHFNPAVSLVFAIKGDLARRDTAALHRSPDCGRHRRHDRRPSDVRPAGHHGVRACPHRQARNGLPNGWRPSAW